MTGVPVPVAIHRDDHELLVTWTEEHVSRYPARVLRLACQCAECRDEFSGQPLVDPRQVPMDVRLVTVSLVGGYGFQVQWSDGHHTGIYPFADVLASCRCERCAGGR